MEKQEDKNKMQALNFKLEVWIRPSEGSNSLWMPKKVRN